MLDRAYHFFGFILCKEKVLKKQIEEVLTIMMNTTKKHEEQMEAYVAEFVKALKIASSDVVKDVATKNKIVMNSYGDIGWGDSPFLETSTSNHTITISS